MFRTLLTRAVHWALAAAVALPLAFNGAPAAMAADTTPTRISFARGATNAVVSSTIAANETRQYVLRALKGQTLMINVSSSTNGVGVQVVGSGKGEPVVFSRSADGANWVGTLPANQDYVIKVSANNNAATFSMNVTIPRRISFARGATSGSVDGSIATRRTNTYILRAAKNQTMSVTITSKDAMALTVYGLTDGQPLVRAGGAGVSSWSGTLPADQDYIINVVPGVDTATFTLTVTIK